VALIAGLTLVAAYRRELHNVPRIRVGPLVTQLPGKERLRFFALGETETGNRARRRLTRVLGERCHVDGGIDGILLLGDNSYPSGETKADSTRWQEHLLAPFNSPCLKDVPIFPVLGSDDYLENPAAQIELSLLNPRWHFPNRFYAVDFGHLLRLVAFDSTMSEFCLESHFCAGDFLFESVEHAPATWVLVTAHDPLESASTEDGGYSPHGLGHYVIEPFLCKRADAWIAAGAHHLEHRVPVGCRMESFVSGGGGSELTGVHAGGKDVRFLKSSHGFLELELDKHVMTTRFIDEDGKVLSEAVKAAAAPQS